MYIYKEFSINENSLFFKKMRTGSLIMLLVQKCLCVSIARGKPSIYILLNIGYDLYVVYVVYVVVYVDYVVDVVYVVYVVYVVV